MDWEWMVAKEGTLPTDIPPMSGVNIEWDHGNTPDSRKADQDMVTGYFIVAKLALNSRYMAGRAIDMTISGSGTRTLQDKNRKEVAISTTPRTSDNAQLATVGATFAVIKAAFAGDPPHWSDDGH
jgi:hypothetical protein